MSPLDKNNILRYVDCFLVDPEFRAAPVEKWRLWGRDNEETEKIILQAKTIFISPGSFDVWSELLILLADHTKLPVLLIILCHSDYSMNSAQLEPLQKALPNTVFWIQNWCGDLSGCDMLPIGINSYGLKKIHQPIKKKTLSITYVTPNSYDRMDFHNFLCATPEMGPYCLPYLERDEYFTAISEALFVVCPCGNGFDTYRFWECLHYATIPIVKENTFFLGLKKQYPLLPFIIVKDWNNLLDLIPKLTIEYYKSIVSISDFTPATNEYWMNKFFTLIEIIEEL
jgi:hypothetical protein